MCSEKSVSKVTEGVSGHATDFLLFSKGTATGPSCGKSIHIPHLCALRGCSLVSSKLLQSRKLAVCPEIPPCPETPSVTLVKLSVDSFGVADSVDIHVANF